MLFGRGPRGPCGLKFLGLLRLLSAIKSRPARALWIEMVKENSNGSKSQVEAREGLVD